MEKRRCRSSPFRSQGRWSPQAPSPAAALPKRNDFWSSALLQERSGACYSSGGGVLKEASPTGLNESIADGMRAERCLAVGRPFGALL